MTPEPTTDAPPASPAADPPLRIHHLMAASGVAAVLLVASRLREFFEAFDDANWASPLVLFVLGSGLAATALAFRAVWRCQGRPLLAHPGDGVSVLVLIDFGFVLVFFWVLSAYFNESELMYDVEMPTIVELFLTYYSLVQGMVMGAAALAFAKWLTRGWWRLFFIATVVASLACYALQASMPLVIDVTWYDSGVYQAITFSPNLLWLAALAAACLADARHARQRSWTHWWGLTALVVPQLAQYAKIAYVIAKGGN